MGPSYFALAGVPRATPYFSKNPFIFSFPPDFSMHASCSADHESIVALRTKLTCTPRDRCTPEQLRQRKMPWLTDAQSGFVVEQSAHVRLVSSCDSAWRIFRASGFVISNTRAFRSGPSASSASFASDRSWIDIQISIACG